jgi:hypothetical protein
MIRSLNFGFELSGKVEWIGSLTNLGWLIMNHHSHCGRTSIHPSQAARSRQKSMYSSKFITYSTNCYIYLRRKFLLLTAITALWTICSNWKCALLMTSYTAMAMPTQ